MSKHGGSFTLYAEWDENCLAIISPPDKEDGAHYFVLDPDGQGRHRITMCEKQIRHLREQITKALGESPQSESEIEAFESLVSSALDCLSQMDDIINNKFVACKPA